MPNYRCVKCGQPIQFWSNQYHLPIHASCLTGEDEERQPTRTQAQIKNAKQRRNRYDVNRTHRN